MDWVSDWQAPREAVLEDSLALALVSALALVLALALGPVAVVGVGVVVRVDLSASVDRLCRLLGPCSLAHLGWTLRGTCWQKWFGR